MNENARHTQTFRSEKWTNKMKQKLDGHKATPPAGLWESISSEMGLQNEPAPKTVAIKRWPWAVAAVVLALVGFFALYQFDKREPLPQVAQATHTTQTPQKPTTPTINKEVNPESQQLALATVHKRPKSEVASKQSIETSQPNPTEPIQEVSEETPQQKTSEETHQQKVSEDALQQTAMVASHPAYSETDHHATAHYQAKQMVNSNVEDKWSIGFNASGGLLTSAGHNRTGMVFDNAKETNEHTSQPQEKNPIYTQTDYVSKHHLPISLGLSLHYQLNPHLALLSGVNYTYLYSEFTIPFYPNNHETQKLHYLGIPVGLSYQLWKANGFSLYLSGAAQLEKCLNEKPWQWSVSAAAGAEYAITPQIGLYLEPSLGYYFNDGTSFEHYYKEHPLAPSIEFGLRLHISGK